MLDKVALDLEPFTVKIEEQLIQSVLDFMDTVWASLEYDSQISTNLIDKSKKPESFYYETFVVPPASLATYIDEIILSPIKLNLTFKKKASTQESGNLMILETVFSNNIMD